MNISMWSGPRNISTAMMYSFRQRSDLQVVDEPLYGVYLSAVADVAHPDVDLVKASMDCDATSVVAAMRRTDGPRMFFKNMAHHLDSGGHHLDSGGHHLDGGGHHLDGGGHQLDIGGHHLDGGGHHLDLSVLDGLVNFLLCRPPEDQLVSLAKGMTALPTLRDTGYEHQVAILRHLVDAGVEPVVVVAPRVLADPEGMLRRLCAGIGLEWDPAMLSWPTGPKPEDGVWAPHWYAAAHASSGFGAPRPRKSEVPQELALLLKQALPLYEELVAYAVG